METIIAWLLLLVHSIVPVFHVTTQYISDDMAPVVQKAQEKIAEIANSSVNALPVATSVKAIVQEKVSAMRQAAVPSTSDSITVAGVLAQTNVERYKAGLPLLVSDPTLTRIAEQKAQDMIARNYFAHESPDGVTIGDLAKSAGYAYLSVGENLAMGDFANSTKLVTAWMNSPGHRANILSKTYTQIGIAAVRGTINGHDGWVSVQEFGLPQSVCPAPDATVRARLETVQSQITTLDKKLAQQSVVIDKMSQTDPNRPTAVAQYNAMVNTRNEFAAQYSRDAKGYNQQIQSFNACLSAALKK